MEETVQNEAVTTGDMINEEAQATMDAASEVATETVDATAEAASEAANATAEMATEVATQVSSGADAVVGMMIQPDTPERAQRLQDLVEIGESTVYLMGVSFIIGSLFTILILLVFDFMRRNARK